MSETETNSALFEKIKALSLELGFVACGCAKSEELVDEEPFYATSKSAGFFAGMGYLSRNIEKRFNPGLLVPGAKSVLVFLAPFGRASEENLMDSMAAQHNVPLVSEFARGLDYHIVIKNKLHKILQLIAQETSGVPSELNLEATSHVSNAVAISKNRSTSEMKNIGRAFTDSAPVMERAWAVKAGLGFIGKNNFLISPEHGIKNFIGIIITTVELPYFSQAQTADKELYADAEISADIKLPTDINSSRASKCGTCSKCIDACKNGALRNNGYAFDARRCTSYATIEATEDAEEIKNNSEKARADEGLANTGESGIFNSKWIFGCDECMNACPWNRKNKEGWPEFRTNEKLLSRATAEWWQNLDEQEFKRLFGDTPLMRAGLKKIQNNIIEAGKNRDRKK
jgi:epoxyqueuosine reductase